MRVTPAAALALAALLLAACTPVPGDDGAPTPVPPPTAGAFDYQLGEAYGAPGALAVVVRDVTADPLPGAYNVCYVNGFQTQPGTLADWEREHPQALLREGGEPDAPVVRDPDWPDEAVLDPSTPEQREAILAVVGPQVDACATAGFDAVELDNLDTFLRFDGVARDGALALAREYVGRAHEAGLAVGQKNAADVGAAAREEAGFDFAVVEECARYEECGVYREIYGDHVLQIEYTDGPDGRPSFAQVCADPDRAPLTVLRDRLLVGPGSPGYVREQCD